MEGADIHTVFKALQVILTHSQEREPGSSLFGLIPASLFDTATELSGVYTLRHAD